MMNLRRLLIGMLLLTTIVWATERHFYLGIEESYEIMTPDSNPIAAWAFRFEGETPSVPGPVISVIVGDQVFVHFHNTSDQPQALHFHGLDVDAANDGFPGVSSLVQSGATEIFQFVANNIGNFAYAAMADGPKSRQMGLYGLIKVRPVAPSPEYDLVSTGIDPAWHAFLPPDIFTYLPEYLMIGGRVPDITNRINLLPVPTISVTDTIQLNFFNAGFWPQEIIFHPGTGTIVSSDGRAWDFPEPVNDLKIYPGERYGVRVHFSQIGEYSGEWWILNPLTGVPALSVTWNQTVVDESLIRGDLNGDTIVNVQDIVLLVNIILGNISPTPAQLFTADLTMDGAVDVTDVVTLVNMILGI